LNRIITNEVDRKKENLKFLNKTRAWRAEGSRLFGTITKKTINIILCLLSHNIQTPITNFYLILNEMSLLTFDEVKLLDRSCETLLEEFDVRFVGVINKFAHMSAGGFKMGINPYELDKRKIMYTQLGLNISMEREFDNTLGTVEYVTSKRKNVIIITIPMNDDYLVISAETSANVELLVKKAKKIFQI